MKAIPKIAQWTVSVFFAMFALTNGLHYSTLLFLLATALIMPIPAVRDFLRKKLKIKNWLAVTLAFVIFLTACGHAPVDTASDPQDNTPSTSQTTAPTTKPTQKPTTATTNPTTTTSASITSSTTTKPTTKPTTPGGVAALDPNKLPAWSGQPYIIVNNNVPNFSAAELTATGYETYLKLDTLGRTQMALASVGKDTMPADDEERGSISSITPSGWKQAKYDCISGGWLYNRCHLIGWQLSAENANKGNLITGTKYLNIYGMLPFENMVADYIKETGNHVAYRITPIYKDNNLLASGVQMEAYSVEDDGEGICFNVYCYNVQPDVTINYLDGSSTGPNTSATTTKPTTTKPTTTATTKPSTTTKPSATEPDMVWIPQSGSKYHSHSGCSGMIDPSYVTKEYAESLGFTPCKRC